MGRVRQSHDRLHHRVGRARRSLWPILIGLLALVLGFPLGTAQARPLMAPPPPTATPQLPPLVALGQNFDFPLVFDNTSTTETGYGPFVNVYFPSAGVDGNDGISFVVASYLSATVRQTTFVCTGSNRTHPLTGQSTACPSGQQLVVLELPFGSFTPDQPAATINVTASVSPRADIGVALAIRTAGGFRFGADPLDNAGSDPPIVRNPPLSFSTTPTVLIALDKDYIGPEDETATGPNYPRQYRIIVDIANQQLFSTLTITDVLPSNLQFVSVDSITVNGTAVTAAAPATPSTTTPGGTLARVLSNVTGTTSATDVVLVFSFYVPLDDTTSSRVIDPLTGNDVLAIDDAQVSGTYVPLDAPSDPQTVITSNTTVQDHVLTPKSLAIQKSVVNLSDTSLTPGDVLQYTLSGQVSDFFAFQNIVITDTLGDGQRFKSDFTPQLTVNANPYSLATAPINGANYTVTPNYTGGSPAPNDGTTAVNFRVSNEIVTRGQNGRLIGGCVNPAGGTTTPACATYNDGATTFTIVFQAVVQDKYADDFPSGNDSLDPDDRVRNSVVVSGDLLANATLVTNGNAEDDNSSSLIEVPKPTLQKSIYQINGVAPGATAYAAPGDTVTYRFTYQMPTGDIEGLSFTDFLPLPIFQATQVATFDPTVSASVPLAGTAKYGPSDTFSALPGAPVPTLASNAGSNSLRFAYNTYDDTASNTPRVIDLLFSVTVSNQPFADRLQLTNQVRAARNNTFLEAQNEDAIVQLVLTEPNLRITKGVVATDRVGTPAAVFSPATPAPTSFTTTGCPAFGATITSTSVGTTPINSNLSNVDYDDVVTFAIMVENRGSGRAGAFDVLVRDALPTNMTLVGTPCVTNGARTVLTTESGGDLFGAGLQLQDAVGQGALTRGRDDANAVLNTGTNILIITYNARLTQAVQPNQALSSTAMLEDYAGAEGGPGFLPGANSLTDAATVTVAGASVTKTLASTNQSFTAGTNVAIGETVQYTVTLTVPESTIATVQVIDQLPGGTAFVSCDSASATPGVSFTTAPCAAPTVPAGGGSVTFSLGTITNSDTNNANPDRIMIVYTVVVLNDATTDRDDPLQNNAQFRMGATTLATGNTSVVIVEPTLQINTDVAPDRGDAGDLFNFTITLQHTTASNADAFDVVVQDTLPAGLTLVPGSLDCGAGVQDPATCTVVGNGIQATYSQFLDNATGSTITFQARLNDDVIPGQVITDQATVAYTSLPGVVSASQSTFNANGVERTGTGSPAYNDLSASDPAIVTVENAPTIKRITQSSEPTTGLGEVVIGEVVRYRLNFRLAEGQAPNFQFADLLPAGLQFLNDSTTRIAFVADGVGISSNAAGISGAGLNQNGNESNVENITPTFGLPAAQIGGGPFSDGTDAVFSLGTLTNSDRDANQEYVLLEFNALVTNVASNQAGVSLDNRYEGRINGSVTATSDVAAMTVLEPQITDLARSATLVNGDAGDTVTFRVTFGNAGISNLGPAFNVVLTDTLPSGLTVTGPINVTPNGGATGFTTSSTDTSVVVNIASMPANSSITVEYQAQVSNTATVGQSYGSNSLVTYTSLFGPAGRTSNATGSNTPGSSGTATGERNGTSGTVNDYNDTAAATVTLATPTVDKLTPNPTRYVIGEVVTYNIRVSLPEGTTQALSVVDDLPPGLSYLNGQVITTAAASGGLLNSDYEGTLPNPTITNSGGSGDDVSFAFGNVLTTADNNAANNQFLVRLQALVRNQASNQNGTTLPNIGRLSYTNPNTGATTISDAAVNVLVDEPELTLLAGVDDTTPQFNQVLRYTLVANHLPASTATANDLVITDTLPTGLTFVPGSATFPAGGAVSTVGNQVVFTLPALARTPGSASFSYQATVGGPGTVSLGTALNTSAVLRYTSLPGANADERTGAGGINDYVATNSTSVTVSGVDLAITVSDGGISTTPGGTVPYTLRVTNNGNITATGVVITTTVPVNTTFAQTASTSGWSCPDGAAAGTSCSFTLPATLGAGISTDVIFAVRVDNPVPAGTTQVGDTATVRDDGANGVDPTPADNTAADTTPLTASPDLRILKTDNATTVTPGSTVAYSLTVRNIGNRGATGVVVTETVPVNATFVQAGSTTGWSCADGAVAGTTCTFTVGSLVGTQERTLVFVVRAVNPVAAGVEQLSNTANVADDGANGPDANTVNNSASDITPLLAQPDLQIAKSDGILTTTTSSRITYTLSYGNAGNQAATGVRLTETVPANATFERDGSTAGWSCADEAAAGTTCTLTIGNLAVGGQGTATFVIDLNASVPAGVTTINNTAIIGDDGTNGPDGNGADNTATDSDSLTAQPDLAITVSDGDITASAGGLINYTIDATNVGNQDATGVTVSVTVPANTTFEVDGSTATWSCADGAAAGTTCTFTIGNLAVGGSAQIVFVARVNGSLPAGVTATLLTGSIADDGANGPETNLTNNTDDEPTPLTAQPDLEITKVDAGVSFTPGSTVDYTLTYQNVGTQNATGVVITETVPLNTTFVQTGSTNGWSCADGATSGITCTLTIGNLAVGSSGTAQFVVRVNNPLPAGTTQITNTVRVADDGTNGVEPTPANNTATDTTPLAAQPDLQVQIDDGVLTTTPGSLLTYTLPYSNTGNRGATNVALQVTVPDNTTFEADGSTAGWSCTDGAGPGTVCTLPRGTLNGGGAGGTATIVLRVNSTVPAGETEISTTVTIADDGTNGADPTPANNTATDTDTLQAQPDLRVGDSDAGITVQPGQLITYTLPYSNTGNQGATGVALVIVVPDYTTFVPTGSTDNWSCDPDNNQGSLCTLDLDSLAADAGGTATFVLQVAPTLPAGVTSIPHVVEIVDDEANGADPTPANNIASENTPVTAQPDLRITITDNDITTTAGGVITYTLSYTNIGNQDATGVQIEVPIPANSVYNAANSDAGWSCQAGPTGTVCTFTVGDLAASAGGSVRFAVQVNQPLPAGVTAINAQTTIADDGANGADPTPANNIATETTPTTAAPDLQISKTDGGTSATAGGLITYTLRYTNTGTIGATGGVITETVPLNTTFVQTGSTGSWSCANGAPAGTTCTLAVGSLAGGGGTGTARFVVRVNVTLAAGVVQTANTASIADDGANGTDPTLGNNTASDTTPLVAEPNLQLTKDDGGVTARTGQVVTYTLRYRNIGTQAASGVVITETVPLNTSFNAAVSSAGWSCPNGSLAGTTCTFTVGDLLAGAAGEVRFAVTVAATLPAGTQTVANTATVDDDGANGADPDPTDNTATATTPVVAQPDLRIAKTDGGVGTMPGGTVIYTLHYTNTGDIDLTGVTLSEVVPTHTRFVALGSSGWSCANGAPAGTACTLAVGNLAAGGNGTATFVVQVVNALPAGVQQLTNTVTIADDGQNGQDVTPADNTATDATPVQSAPDLALAKIASSGAAVPGRPITYTLQFSNTGNIGATGVVITEQVPANTTYRRQGSTSGWSCADGAPAGTACTLSVGSMPAGATGTAQFIVIPLTPPTGVTTISNTAVIADDGANGADPTPPNNTAVAASSYNTTSVTLTSFTATRSTAGVTLRWSTSAELNTLGFRLLRSTDANRANAVQITGELIPATGDGQSGGSYSWLDRGAQPGVQYRYWLVETSTNNSPREYGPITVTEGPTNAPYRVFLPLIRR